MAQVDKMTPRWMTGSSDDEWKGQEIGNSQGGMLSHYLKIELLGHAGTTPLSNLDPRTRLNFLPRIPRG